MSDDKQTTSMKVDAESFAIPKWFAYLVSVILVPLVGLMGHLTIRTSTHDTRITGLEANTRHISEEIDEQTKEIVSLRLQIERLLVVKPYDVYLKVEALEKKIDQLKRENP